MYRIDSATAATTIPAPEIVGTHPNGFFTNGDVLSGVPGTIMPADWCNAVQEEICKVITDAGIALSKTDRGQLSQAIALGIQGNKPPYGTSATAPNAYVVTATPAPLSLTAGLFLFVKFTNANTAAATINVNSLGVKSIVKPDNSALAASDIAAGQVAAIVYDGTNFVLLDVNLAAYATTTSVNASVAALKLGIQNTTYSSVADSGSVNAYAATLAPAVTSYVAGLFLVVKITNTNTTAACTLNVNGLGVKSIKLISGVNPNIGDVFAGMEAAFFYDGTNFQLLNPNMVVKTIKRQVFSASGTYTPSAGLIYADIECWGGGAGSGGGVSAGSLSASSGGGGSGGYSKKLATYSTIGASQTVTVGAAGAAGTTAPTSGGNGGDTSVGSICIAKGGTGSTAVSSNVYGAGGAGGIAGTGDFTGIGQTGFNGYGTTGISVAPQGGRGGSTILGNGGDSVSQAAAAAGTAGTGFGAGGGGCISWNGTSAAGAAGAAGYVVITEYCNQ